MGYVHGAMNEIARLSSKKIPVVQNFEYNKSHKRTAFNLQTRIYFLEKLFDQADAIIE